MKKIIVFDVDDTLIDSDYKFQLTYCDCIKEILFAFETRAPQIDEVYDLGRAKDRAKLKSYPARTRYMPKRLEDTWSETYLELCKQYGVKPKKHTQAILKGIIDKNFDEPWFVIPGAGRALREVSGMSSLELHALTIGDKKIQFNKLNSTGLSDYFARINVVKVDKGPYLRRLAKEYGKDRVVMIGNSLRSDINPAIRAGVRAIYIPRNTWHHLNIEVDNSQFTTLKEISQVGKVLKSWYE